MSTPELKPDERCAVCNHYESQHVAEPRMCADCARDNTYWPFHTFAAAAIRLEPGQTLTILNNRGEAASRLTSEERPAND